MFVYIITLLSCLRIYEYTNAELLNNSISELDMEVFRSHITYEEALEKFKPETALEKHVLDTVHFYLYKRNSSKVELFINDIEGLILSDFDFLQNTKFIVHGWKSSGSASGMVLIRDAYLKVTNYNIIVVDWSHIAKLLYVLARVSIVLVAERLAGFISFLVACGVMPENIHLIGHSLGAHVVGLAGSHFREEDNMIYAISGLDPAGPLFESAGLNERLDRSDAHHVEVLHTNGLLLGYARPMGHLDFYFNYGFCQPGCGHDIASCPHRRAVEYFAESIVSSTPFTAIKCDGYADIVLKECANNIYKRKWLNVSGLHINDENDGIYYLKTASKSPYAGGHPDNWKNIS